MPNKTLILVALGANLPSGVGVPAATLRQAIADLAESGLEMKRKSAFYATPCFPAGAGPDYVNAVATFEDTQGRFPAQILEVLHGVEAAHGRQRLTRWAGRVLDLDLLAMDDSVLPDAVTFARWRDLSVGEQAQHAPDQLILPHPRIADRAFVLVPLAEVAPDWRHPVSGRSVVEMRDALPPGDVASVRLLE